MVSILTNK